METTPPQTQAVCTCDHFAPNVRILRPATFNCDLAAFYAKDQLSANAVLDWVYVELLEHRTGTLHDLADLPIDLDHEDANGDTLLDRVFGADPARFINHYRRRARSRGRNRLKLSVLRPILILHYARQVWLCRSSGPCSGH